MWRVAAVVSVNAEGACIFLARAEVSEANARDAVREWAEARTTDAPAGLDCGALFR